MSKWLEQARSSIPVPCANSAKTAETRTFGTNGTIGTTVEDRNHESFAAFEERAAICEYDGALPRSHAELIAAACLVPLASGETLERREGPSVTSPSILTGCAGLFASRAHNDARGTLASAASSSTRSRCRCFGGMPDYRDGYQGYPRAARIGSQPGPDQRQGSGPRLSPRATNETMIRCRRTLKLSLKKLFAFSPARTCTETNERLHHLRHQHGRFAGGRNLSDAEDVAGRAHQSQHLRPAWSPSQQR